MRDLRLPGAATPYLAEAPLTATPFTPAARDDIAAVPRWHRPDVLRIALAALLVVSIGRVHEHFRFLMPLRPGLLLQGLAVGYLILRPGSLSRSGVFATWPPRLVLAFALFALIGAPFGLSAGASAAFVLNVYSRVLLLFFLVLAASRGPADTRLFMWAYAIAAGFLCYLSIFVVNIVPQYGSLVYRLDDDITSMFDPNDIGVILAIAVPIALILFQTSNRAGKAAMVLLLLGAALTSARSGSRGGLVGLAAVIGTLLLLARRISVGKRLLVVVGLVGGLALAAPSGYWAQMSTMFNPSQDYNATATDGRFQIWKRGMGYTLQYPVFGVGISNFSRAEGTISEKARRRMAGTGILYAAPHNSWVQVTAELGVPGGIMFTVLVFGQMIALLRLRRRVPPSWHDGSPDERFLYAAAQLLPVSFVGFATTAFFLTFAYLDPIYLLTAFSASTICAVHLRLRNAPPPRAVRAPAPATSIVARPAWRRAPERV